MPATSTAVDAISWQDFAQTRGESEYPELWDALEGFWCAGLGPTGTVLFNVGPQHKDRQAAAFVNLTGSAWGPMLLDGRPSIDFFGNSSTGYIDAGVGHIDESRNEITIGGYVSLDASRGSVNDWRFMARAATTATDTHRYMLGSLNGTNVRSRFLVSGSVITDFNTGSFWTRGTTMLACVTYQGTAVEFWKNAVQFGNSSPHTGTLQPNDDTDSPRLYLGATKNGGGVYGTIDAQVYCFFIYSRILREAEQILLRDIPHAPLVRRRTLVSAFVPAPAVITDGEIAAATGPKRHDVDLPPAEVVAY